MKVMGECHRRAYRLIHNIHEELGYAEPKVGLAMHMRAFVPYNAKKFVASHCLPHFGIQLPD